MPGDVSLSNDTTDSYRTSIQMVNLVSLVSHAASRSYVHCPSVGQLEATMFRQFCIGQNLRAMMSSDGMSEALETRKDSFSKIFQNDKRGTLYNDALSFESADGAVKLSNVSRTEYLDAKTIKLLRDCVESHPSISGFSVDLFSPVLQQTSVTFQGQTFSPTSTAVGNSHIIYTVHVDADVNAKKGNIKAKKGDLKAKKWCPGRIVTIFHLQGSPALASAQATFFVVEPYESLTKEERIHDKYSEYSAAGAGGTLYYNSVSPRHWVVPLRDIVCHFAATPITVPDISRPCLHVLTLNHVRHLYSAFMLTQDSNILISFFLSSASLNVDTMLPLYR